MPVIRRYILVAAGLLRLGFCRPHPGSLDVSTVFLQGGQGAVGIECRSADSHYKLLEPLHHADIAGVTAERALNKLPNGGRCSYRLPCSLEGEQLWFAVLLASPILSTASMSNARIRMMRKP